MTTLESAQNALARYRYGEATPLFESVLREEPENAEAMKGLFACRSHEGDAIAAAALLSSLSNIMPGSTIIDTYTGVLHLSRREYRDALDAFGRAFRQNADDLGVHARLAFVYACLGQRSRATDALRKVESAKPGTWDVWYMCGETSLCLQRFQTASRCYISAFRVARQPLTRWASVFALLSLPWRWIRERLPKELRTITLIVLVLLLSIPSTVSYVLASILFISTLAEFGLHWIVGPARWAKNGLFVTAVCFIGLAVIWYRGGLAGLLK